MNDQTTAPPPIRRPRRRLPKVERGALTGYIIFLMIAFVPIFIWFGCRIEPEANEIAILTRKTGADLPSGQIIATEEGQKGVQLEVLPEGRYFRNPYTWDWEIERITDIPAGKLGIKTRLFGKNLPQGQIIAGEDTKGIVEEVLRPGKYRINQYAYHVEQFDAINIRPGHVGVITMQVGEDVLNTDPAPDHVNTFLVDDGKKGVVAKVLDPGTYYINPYIMNVVEVNLQSQRFEMSGNDVISFLTLDGFTVTVEGTIEFAIKREDSSLLTHRVGDMDDIVKKVILPRTRGFSRIEGSKYPAIDFIVGETRQRFQDTLETHLRERCTDWGVDVKSVLIRKILPPDEIASINRDREVAVQDANKYNQQIQQAKSKAELVKQEMLAIQNKEKVEADTARIKAVIDAEKGQAVRIIAAEKDLDVAKVRFDAATFEAQAVINQAEGQRDAIRVRNIAEAGVLSDQVKAFQSGMTLARFRLYEKVGPRIDTLLTSDGVGGLGQIFTPFLPKAKEVAQ
ncbi:MAG: hypothetical protein KJ626_02620 [Verrucomicrobia bacterium]|nr:hypothetical protein [Verrucomicrobiota bacterium]